VDQDRQVRAAKLADEAGQPGGVVEVAGSADWLEENGTAE
jgi:hypothetical protein